MTKNVIITGFMGTGKTCAGKNLASRLGCGFIDIDRYIEEKEKKTISEIFSEKGEEYFRAVEKEAVRKISAQQTERRQKIVISTGGGTIADEENFQNLVSCGVIICLTADVEEILARVGSDGSRPLLAVDDAKERALKLLEARRPFYDRADFSVDTGDRSPLEVVNEITGFLKREGIWRG